jgi:hypothetical protein
MPPVRIKNIPNGKYVTLYIMAVLKVSLLTAGVIGCAGAYRVSMS